MKKKVLILLSTYNGEKYIEEQLESILSQVDVDIDVLVRDDGSTDNTISIIKAYATKYNNVSYILGENVGYAKSFWELLKHSNGYMYYAFSDQDDTWDSNKIASAIKFLSKANGPALYTSRVVSVDNEKRIISENCFKSERALGIYESFIRNNIPGCVYVFNNHVRDLAAMYTGYIESHDWAVYIITNIFGIIFYDNNSYIQYRIHSNNAIGKKNVLGELIIKIRRFMHKSKCTRSNFAKGLIKSYDIKSVDNELYNNIYFLANYKESWKSKYKLLFNKNFKGLIFKIFVLLERV